MRECVHVAWCVCVGGGGGRAYLSLSFVLFLSLSPLAPELRTIVTNAQGTAVFFREIWTFNKMAAKSLDWTGSARKFEFSNSQHPISLWFSLDLESYQARFTRKAGIPCSS